AGKGAGSDDEPADEPESHENPRSRTGFDAWMISVFFQTTAPPAASKGCVSDAELVARARRGDAEAFGELVDRHRAAVYRAAQAALGSANEAEDVAQEAFLAAYRKMDSYRGDASFKTWLLKIAWRQALTRRRRLRS